MCSKESQLNNLYDSKGLPTLLNSLYLCSVIWNAVAFLKVVGSTLLSLPLKKKKQNLNPCNCLLLLNISVSSTSDLELAAQIFMQYTCVCICLSVLICCWVSAFSDVLIQFKLNDYEIEISKLCFIYISWKQRGIYPTTVPIKAKAAAWGHFRLDSRKSTQECPKPMEGGIIWGRLYVRYFKTQPQDRFTGNELHYLLWSQNEHVFACNICSATVLGWVLNRGMVSARNILSVFEDH